MALVVQGWVIEWTLLISILLFNPKLVIKSCSTGVASLLWPVTRIHSTLVDL